MKKIIDIKKLITLLIVFIMFYYNDLFTYFLIFLLKINIKEASYTTRLLLSSFSSICFLILLLIIYYKDLKKYFKALRGKFLKTMDSSFKYYLLGIFGMIVTNLLLNIVFKGNGANNEKLVQVMIKEAPILMLITAGIMGPIIEELVFRKSFMDAFKNKWLFIISSGFVFGFMHVLTSSNTISDYLYFIPYMMLGLAFAYMDYKEDSVLPSIIIHMTHNTFLILVAIFI